ncbi:MAG: hypothetical protein ACRC1K_24645 [Planctomycetia bacterium]
MPTLGFRTLLFVGLTALVWSTPARAQYLPPVTDPAAAAVAAPTAAAAPAVAAPAAAPTNLFSLLGLTKAGCKACKQCICNSGIGKLLTGFTSPLSSFTGGVVPSLCPPQTPTDAQAAQPGAQGAAAAIQKEEAEAKARRAAVKYLATINCHYYPEAEKALIESLRTDRNECVRYEAALAFAQGCCCSKRTINALTLTVSCGDKDGNPSETSPRVQKMARIALARCVACYQEAAPRTPPEAPTPGSPAPAAAPKASAGVGPRVLTPEEELLLRDAAAALAGSRHLAPEASATDALTAVRGERSMWQVLQQARRSSGEVVAPAAEVERFGPELAAVSLRPAAEAEPAAELVELVEDVGSDAPDVEEAESGPTAVDLPKPADLRSRGLSAFFLRQAPR